jgi:chromosome segregation ATPase
MKEKIKTILMGLLISLIVFPTVTLGGSFVSSLIQGKTVEEAIQILAEQIDSLIGRVEVIETKQMGQEQSIEELEAELFAIKNKEVCDKLKSFEDKIQSLTNSIPQIEQNYISYKNRCQSFIANIPQECLSFKNTDKDLDCCYKYSPPENYPEHIPKDCCMFFYVGEENYNSSLAQTQQKLENLLSNSEYLQAKEECVK